MGKKILIFSLGPIFKDYVSGGSQKILREVAIYLGSKGHKVKILCVKRDDNKDIFELAENVEVCPILRFRQYYPAAYFTSPHNIVSIINIINEEIKKCDVFYIHDSQLDFPFLFDDIPTITSLRDYIYPETLIGAFNFDGDKIIVNSDYVRDCVKSTIGHIRNNIDERIVVIPNGINLNLFKKTDTKKIREIISVNERDQVILYPHRP